MATIMTDEVRTFRQINPTFCKADSKPFSVPHFSLNQIFHDVAYKAKDRSDLLAGIDEFLDQVTVLPPGEWDPSIRIEPPKSVPSQVGLNPNLCALTETFWQSFEICL